MSASWRLKITLVGSSRVGKTTFMRGDLNSRGGRFNTMETFGIDFDVVESYSDNGDLCRCSTWEIGLRVRIGFLYSTFFKGAAGTLLFFDLSRYQTFEDLNAWVKLIRKISGNIPIILVGTKNDLEPDVFQEEINDFVRDKGLIGYYSTTINDKCQRDKIFKHLVTEVIENRRSGKNDLREPIRESIHEILSELTWRSFTHEEILDKQYASLSKNERIMCDRFIEYFSICPFCKTKNHVNYLLKFYFSKKKKYIKLKNQLLDLISEDFDELYVNKIILGIPCCGCFKSIFNEPAPTF